MAATLRVRRGTASPDRVVMMGDTRLGSLTDEVMEFEIPPGDHVLSLELGRYHSIPTHVVVDDGAVLELQVVQNPDAVLPLVQGGFVRLERVTG